MTRLNSRPPTNPAIEARGFIFGLAVAMELSVGFVPIRKPGKLPLETVGEDYELEYGSARVEVHRDAIQAGERVLLVDDLIATGGTAEAAIRVIERIGGKLDYQNLFPLTLIHDYNLIASSINIIGMSSLIGYINRQASQTRPSPDWFR